MREITENIQLHIHSPNHHLYIQFTIGIPIFKRQKLSKLVKTEFSTLDMNIHIKSKIESVTSDLNLLR